MERTESIVIQVAPAHENSMIKQMEQFGWSLQGRQEIQEEGDVYVTADPVVNGDYMVKRKVSRYVKLHFSRSLKIPNLEKIRALEEEYFNLPEPAFPYPPKGSFGYFLMFVQPLFLVYYFLIYRRQRAAAEKQLEEVRRRRQEILREVAGLLSSV